MYLFSVNLHYTLLDKFRDKMFPAICLEKSKTGVTIANKMFGIGKKSVVGLFLLVLCLVGPISAQTAFVDNISQEVSEGDNIPVIIKHLPDWEKVKDKAVLTPDAPSFAKAVGGHPIAQVVNFTAGTEAIIADYDAGRLAIVEFTTPQMATDADAKIWGALEANAANGQSNPAYRRVGNYAVFVFNPRDEASAAALIDQVKYEKVVQWLGHNPYAQHKAERDTVKTTSEVVLNAIQITGYILLVTLIAGGFAGFMVFRSRNRQRLRADSYTDAGGMTRLNLDGLATTSSTDRLLHK